MPTAAQRGMAMTLTDEYEKKVREIALLQNRCACGADLVADKPKDADRLTEHPTAA